MRLVPLARPGACVAATSLTTGSATPATDASAPPATPQATALDASPVPTSIAAVGALPPPAAAEIGYKAARLAAALQAGLLVLPGIVVPVWEGRRAMGAGADAVRARGLAAGRVAVLAQALEPALVRELCAAVDGLGGRVIVRSSSPLEGDGRWAGAFSSVTGVGRGDVAAAVRSCWASAFAVDPLRRLGACGLPLEALQLAILLQPEITPEAGGLARTEPGSRAGPEVSVAGVRGHPGQLLSGWAEGARDASLAAVVGTDTVANVAELARRVHAELRDDVIEWAASRGKVWLLQSLRSAPPACPAASAPQDAGPADPVAGPAGPAGIGMPALAALIQQRGTRVPGQPAAPGTAAGVLLPGRPHETMARDCRDAILLVDRPVPALAPLLFGARGIISRSGAASSHLAEVARSLGIPMVTGCRPGPPTGPVPGAWLAAINGTTGEVILCPR